MVDEVPDGKDREAAEFLFAKKGMGAPLSSPPDPRTLVASPDPPPVSRTAEVILVLASDPFNAKMYADLLDQRGYSAVIEQEYRSWPTALSRCAPALILLDLGYHGHPSIDMAWRLMADRQFRAIPALAIIDQPNSRHPSDTATVIGNCDGHIIKPVSVPGFFEPIDEILDRPRPR